MGREDKDPEKEEKKGKEKKKTNQVPPWLWNKRGLQPCPAPTILSSPTQCKSIRGRSLKLTTWTSPGAPLVTSTTVKEEFWATKASWFPEGAHLTLWIHPPAEYSHNTS